MVEVVWLKGQFQSSKAVGYISSMLVMRHAVVGCLMWRLAGQRNLTLLMGPQN